MLTPFYDPEKSYEENFAHGPFGAFSSGEVTDVQHSVLNKEPKFEIFGHKVFLPFGNPSYEPSVWQADLKSAVAHAKVGQIVSASFEGTRWSGYSEEDYINDWVLGAKLLKETGPQFEFNKWTIEETHKYTASFNFKINIAFYWFGFDAVTLHQYLGQEALQPFLDRKDKVSIILCRTSNKGAGEFQDLKIVDVGRLQKPLWQIVAEKVSKEWNKNNNCMLVVGATYPEEIKSIRSVIGDTTFLVPGIGVQGGDIKAVLENGLNSKRLGLIINSSRGIIFANNPKEEARKLCEEINKFRI